MSKIELVQAFAEYMKEKFNIVYNEIQIHNFEILYNTLENNSKIPKIVPISMGEGKSEFIRFYCRYKYETDKDFSAVIVNKTIDECDDFCIGLGIKKECKEAYNKSIFDVEKDAFNGIKLEYNNMYDLLPIYDFFIACTLKAFNFKDCIKYKKENDTSSNKNSFIETEYDNRLCSSCEKRCPIKYVKYKIKNFRIIAVTHNRLFFSNNNSDLLEDILYYENENKEKVKRKLLIIDEKIGVFFREVLRIENFNKLKNFIQNCGTDEDNILIKKYEEVIMKLKFDKSKMLTLKNPFSIRDKFSDKLLNLAYNESSSIYKTISFLENITEFEQIHTFYNHLCKKDENALEIAVTKYLGLSNYSNYFDNIVITDATASKDLDYSKSNAEIIDDIVTVKRKIKWYRMKKECKFTKQFIKSDYKSVVEKIGKECSNIIEQNLSSKTLIVTYRCVDSENDTFIEDIEKNITSSKEQYKIIYFGQFTTGVRFLKDYENIIILGQLRKGQFYEESKEYVFKDIATKEELRYNEFLIDTVQQIGRTSYRKGIAPNVYFFENAVITKFLESEITSFFDVEFLEYSNEFIGYERKYIQKERHEKSWHGKFLKFVYNEFLKVDSKQNTYKLEEIKKAIGYTGKDYKRDFLDKSKDFATYDKKSKCVIIDFELARKPIQDILKVDL